MKVFYSALTWELFEKNIRNVRTSSSDRAHGANSICLSFFPLSWRARSTVFITTRGCMTAAMIADPCPACRTATPAIVSRTREGEIRAATLKASQAPNRTPSAPSGPQDPLKTGDSRGGALLAMADRIRPRRAQTEQCVSGRPQKNGTWATSFRVYAEVRIAQTALVCGLAAASSIVAELWCAPSVRHVVLLPAIVVSRQ